MLRNRSVLAAVSCILFSVSVFEYSKPTDGWDCHRSFWNSEIPQGNQRTTSVYWAIRLKAQRTFMCHSTPLRSISSATRLFVEYRATVINFTGFRAIWTSGFVFHYRGGFNIGGVPCTLPICQWRPISGQAKEHSSTTDRKYYHTHTHTHTYWCDLIMHWIVST